MSAALWTAIITSGGVIGSLGLTASRMRQDRDVAQAAAARAEAAAELIEGYSVRVVDAMEQIAAESVAISGSLPGSAPPPRGVRWTLVHDRGDTYRLANSGDAEAIAVTVDGHKTLIGPKNVNGRPDLGPDEALTFVAATAMQTQDNTVTVTWTNDDGTTGQWRYPLPAKSPRP